MWDNQSKSIRTGSARYKEFRTGQARNDKQKNRMKDEVEYSCQYKT
jgi:hypothetical protein